MMCIFFYASPIEGTAVSHHHPFILFGDLQCRSARIKQTKTYAHDVPAENGYTSLKICRCASSRTH